MGDMKDSGVEWIGKIPEKWGECVPLRFCDVQESDVGQYDSAQPYIALENIVSWTGEIVAIQQDAQVDSTVATFSSGDVLFGKLRPYLAKVVRPKVAGQCSTELLPIQPIKHTRDYLFWLLISKGFIDVIDSMTYGVKMPRTSWSQLGSIYCPVPPRSEQKAIAVFLDKSCAAIDTTTATLEAQLSTLERYRASIIHEAVTRGLDPTAPTKPSNVDWIGNIPQEWEVKKLKHLVKSFESGTSVRAASYPAEEREKGVLSLSAVFGGKYNPSANKRIDDDELTRATCQVKSGSLLVSRCNTSEWVGLPAFVEQGDPNLYLPDKLWQIDCGSPLLNKFVWYALHSKNSRGYCGVMSVGSSSSMQNIASFDLLNMYIPFPKEQDESKEIVTYLDAKLPAIDAVIETKRKQLDVLKRRRQSLIYEYVTGKRRVCEEG